MRPKTEDGRPTRRQRITYAIQGGFTDAFVNNELKVDPEPLKKTLLAAIETLSKHIHVRETTIITEHDVQDRFAEATLDEMEAFLDTMHACREAVLLAELARHVPEMVFTSLAHYITWTCFTRPTEQRGKTGRWRVSVAHHGVERDDRLFKEHDNGPAGVRPATDPGRGPVSCSARVTGGVRG